MPLLPQPQQWTVGRWQQLETKRLSRMYNRSLSSTLQCPVVLRRMRLALFLPATNRPPRLQQ
jgi:hypothetical protein